MTDTVTNPALELTARQIGALVEAKLIEWAIPYDYVADFAIDDVRSHPRRPGPGDRAHRRRRPGRRSTPST